ncbi:DUF2933 domain-containing protein [Niveibacterium sp.]|uniref:DUF2933 domain-containing protein n=1 Tax=Niveibacterium sp. TaxID=2017444 RepID=UPI0035B2D494
MNTQHNDRHDNESAPSGNGEHRLAQRARMVAVAFVGLALAALIFEHRAHVLGALPYLVILLCPLMHLFMHGGHHHGHGAAEQKQPPKDPPQGGES